MRDLAAEACDLPVDPAEVAAGWVLVSSESSDSTGGEPFDFGLRADVVTLVLLLPFPSSSSSDSTGGKAFDFGLRADDVTLVLLLPSPSSSSSDCTGGEAFDFGLRADADAVALVLLLTAWSSSSSLSSLDSLPLFSAYEPAMARWT